MKGRGTRDLVSAMADGLRISFDGDDIIPLRPSGKRPRMRCYIESTTVDRAAILNAQALAPIAQGRG